MKPRKPEHANKVSAVAGAPGFQIRRWLESYAYAENGNVHNPTPHYWWYLLLDGKPVDNSRYRKTLVARARHPHARKLYTD
jgi:hypothetical protein